MKTLELRTSLFRFDPTQLGRAYRVVIGEHYLDAWQALKGLAKKPHPGLPIIALEEMLTVLSGGPVKVNLSPQRTVAYRRFFYSNLFRSTPSTRRYGYGRWMY